MMIPIKFIRINYVILRYFDIKLIKSSGGVFIFTVGDKSIYNEHILVYFIDLSGNKLIFVNQFYSSSKYSL